VAPYKFHQFEDEIVPYGVTDTIIDMVTDMLESGVSMKEKINNLVSQVNQVIDEVQAFFDSIKDGDNPSDAIVNNLFNKAIKQIMKILEMAFDGIDSAFLAVARFADEEIDDMWGSSMITTVMEKTLKKFYGIYVEQTVAGLEKLMEKVTIDNPVLDKHWEDFMGRLIGEIERSLAKRRADFKIKLVNRSKARRSIDLTDELGWPNPDVEPNRPYLPDLEEEVVPYGLINSIKETVTKMLESGLAIKKRIAEVADRVQAIIRDVQDYYDYIVETTGKTPQENAMEAVYTMLHDRIMEVLDAAFTQIDQVFHKVADYVDELIKDIWAEAIVRKAINHAMETLYDKYTELVVDSLRKAIELIDFIEHEDWDAFVDRLMDSIEDKLDEKLDQFGDKLRQQIPKRSVRAAYGILDTVKDTAQRMLDAGVAIKEKIASLGDKVGEALKSVAEWYKEITADRNGKPVTDAILEDLFQKIVNEIGSIIQNIFDEIADVALTVAEFLDEKIRGIWGEAVIREKVAAFIDVIMEKYVKAVLDALQKVLDVVEFIETNDWDATVDGVVDIIESAMHDKLDELSQKIKDRLNVA